MSKPDVRALKTASFLRALAWLAVCAGLAAAFGLARETRRRTEANRQAARDLESRLLLEAVQSEASLFESLLLSVRHLHDLSEAVQPEAFEEFAATGLRFHESVLGGYAFAQTLPHAVRSTLEASSPGSFPVLEAAPPDGFRPAAPRSGYVRLGYQRPASFTGWPIGFDLGGLAAFQRAWKSERSTGGFLLVRTERSDPGGTGLFLLAPIGSGPAADASPGGFVIARPDPARWIARAMGKTGTTNWTCRLLPPAESQVPLCGRMDIVRLGGADWSLQTTPPPDPILALEARTLALPAALFLIGALTAGLLRVLASRAAAVERLADERTVALREEMAERERLEIEAAEAGRLERERMGRDLHDSIGQKLSAAAMLARAVARKLDGTDAPEAENARLLADLVKEGATEARRIAHGLAPVELPGGGLAEALRRLAEETRNATGLDCEFSGAPDAPEPEPAAALNLYRIAQEAVANTVRHARAQSLRLRLEPKPDGLRLEIEDDGVGLQESPGPGLGLRLMKRRAQTIGATFEIGPGATGGVLVACRLRSNPSETSP
jgi:signal transduction histidine kinase